jgi:pimeloyl-ACP methyl ester carboxylesterase
MPSSSKPWQQVLLLALFILTTSLSWLGSDISTAVVRETLPLANRADLQNYQIVACDRFEQPYWKLDWSQNIFQSSAPAAQERQDYECGFLTVPAHHDRPDGEELQLAVAMIKSTAAHPEPDPLVLLQGGPGGSGIAFFSNLANSQTLGSAALRANRDLIILEQRGTLYSHPQLRCPEVRARMELQFQNPHLSDADLSEHYQQSLQECRQRLAQTVDLTAYNSIENAADIDTLAQVLGYSQINLYGVSYGSLLALQTIRNHAPIVKSAIIDGVLPPQIQFPATVPLSTHQAIAKLTTACAEDEECNRAYPNLLKRFKTQLDRLDRQPVLTSIYDYKTSAFKTLKFTGSQLQSIVISALYSQQWLSAIPVAIDLVERDRFDLVAYLFSMQLFDETLADGMYYSVTCAEDTDFTPPDLSWLDTQAAQRSIRDLKFFQTACHNWHVPALPQIFKAPVVSDLPVLIFNGWFDPITPSTFGDTVAQTLPNSHIVTFPVGAHGMMVGNLCAANIAANFLKNPLLKPDSNCVKEKSKITFITPKTTFKSPEARSIAQFMAYGQVREIELISVAMLTILSSLFIIPIDRLMQLHRSPQSTKKSPSGRAIMFGLLTGILTAIWLSLEIYGVANMASGNSRFNGLASFVGIDRDYAWINIFPCLIAIASFGLSFHAILSWKYRWWHIFWRIYYTTIAIATIYYAVFASGEILANLLVNS